MTIKTDSYIIGSNADDTRNFLLDTDLAGALRIRRKSDGSGGLLATFDSSGNLQLGAAANANASRMVLVAAQNTTSGSAIDFTGIPSWAKRITAPLNAVSTTGTGNLQMQVGSGSLLTTGYTGEASMGASAAAYNSTSFNLTAAITATSLASGLITLVNIGGNVWVESGNLGNTNTNYVNVSGGAIALAGPLDRIRLFTADVFDAGSVALLIEG
jgi:hypothetical protein